jgi:hypothetical protein
VQWPACSAPRHFSQDRGLNSICSSGHWLGNYKKTIGRDSSSLVIVHLILLLAQHFGLENVAGVNPNLHDKKTASNLAVFLSLKASPI